MFKKSYIKILALLRNGEYTAVEIGKLLGVRERSYAFPILRKLEKLGLVRTLKPEQLGLKERRRYRRNTTIYSITKKGVTYLKLYQRLQRLLHPYK